MKVCGVIRAASVSEIGSTCVAGLRNVDMFEIRLDYLDSPSADEIRSFISRLPRPVILTNRPERFGGRFKGDEGDRLELLRKLSTAGVAYLDLESDLPFEFLREIRKNCKTILSYHNFEETPLGIGKIALDLAGRPADVLKIATQCQSLADAERLTRLKALPGEKITIGMGECGVLTRILARRLDSRICYAALEKDRETAPGQILAQDLRNLYRIQAFDDETEVYGILGWPVAHSLSPHIHNACFKINSMNRVYIPLGTPSLERLREVCNLLGFRGLSVTRPHKISLVDICDQLDETARETGAVNTVVIKAGEWIGYNTDPAGFYKPLQRRLKLEGTHALILGAGGAASAAVSVLRNCGAHVFVQSRNTIQARKFARKWGVHCLPSGSSPSVALDLLVNATPVGMAPYLDDVPYDLELLVSRIRERRPVCIYDLVYNPQVTKLLKKAQELGFQIITGMDMFINQASEQYRLWTGQLMPVEFARKAAEVALNQVSAHHDQS